jgi:hypothetical protein
MAKSMADDILSAVKEGTKAWTRTIKAEERNPASRRYRRARMTRERRVTAKDAADQIIATAYAKVSDNGELWANVRQIMYAARPYIQEQTGQPLDDHYFTQVLLPNYLEEHDCADWKVAYDGRGRFTEPHGGKSFSVGTIEVNRYLEKIHDPELEDPSFGPASIKVYGPSGNFGAMLYLEKEGFDQLLQQEQIADCFDIAIMSNKGVSVTAGRKLADEICHEHDIPLLVLHDFDKAGFTIAGTLQRDTRRYRFENEIETIDLGLDLADVQEMSLAHEHQYLKKGHRYKLMENLRVNGASEDAIEFMFADYDRTRSLLRVELNAMTSRQFIDLLKRRLTEHGIKKVVPGKRTLADTYRLFSRSEGVKKIVEREIKKFGTGRITVPADLEQRVNKHLAKYPFLRWDEAVAFLAGVPQKESPPAPIVPKLKFVDGTDVEKVVCAVLGDDVKNNGGN